jgi:hypothetical protein
MDNLQREKICTLSFYIIVIGILIYFSAFAWFLTENIPIPFLRLFFVIIPGIMILMIVITMMGFLGKVSRIEAQQRGDYETGLHAGENGKDEIQRRNVILTVIIICIIAIGLGLLSIGVPQHNLQWDIEEGDEFTFSVIYQIAFNESLTDPEELNDWLEPLNDTVVTFRVEDLPQIPDVLNANNFIGVILNHTKTSCSFDNGTAIPIPYSSKLNDLFSKVLLPAGDWEFLDGLYLDTYDAENVKEEIRYEYLTYTHNNYFYMEQIGMSLSEIRGWFCTIDMNSGLPISIEEGIYKSDEFGFAFSSLILIVV